MKNNQQTRQTAQLLEGYQPKPGKRYCLRPDGTVDLTKLKPPKGDTAVQPPIVTPPGQPPKPAGDGKAQ